MSKVFVRNFYDIPEKMLVTNLDKYVVQGWCVQKEDKIYVFKKASDAKAFSGDLPQDQIKEVKHELRNMIDRRVMIKDRCKKIDNAYEEACWRLDRKDWTQLGWKYGLSLEMYDKFCKVSNYALTVVLGKKNLKVLLRTCKKMEIKKLKMLLAQIRDKIRIYTERLKELKEEYNKIQKDGLVPWKIIPVDEL